MPRDDNPQFKLAAGAENRPRRQPEDRSTIEYWGQLPSQRNVSIRESMHQLRPGITSVYEGDSSNLVAYAVDGGLM